MMDQKYIFSVMTFPNHGDEAQKIRCINSSNIPLHIPDPLSTTRAAISSSSSAIFQKRNFWGSLPWYKKRRAQKDFAIEEFFMIGKFWDERCLGLFVWMRELRNDFCSTSAT